MALTTLERMTEQSLRLLGSVAPRTLQACQSSDSQYPEFYKNSLGLCTRCVDAGLGVLWVTLALVVIVAVVSLVMRARSARAAKAAAEAAAAGKVKKKKSQAQIKVQHFH